MGEFLTDDGYESIFDRIIAARSGSMFFSKVGDRRVIGSINDLVFQAKYYLNEGDLSPWDTALSLNDAPMSLLGMKCPKEAFGAMSVRGG